jgi:hypothetical protein
MIMITADNAMQTLYQMSSTQPYVQRTYATTARKFTPDPLLAPQRRESLNQILVGASSRFRPWFPGFSVRCYDHIS